MYARGIVMLGDENFHSCTHFLCLMKFFFQNLMHLKIGIFCTARVKFFALVLIK